MSVIRKPADLVVTQFVKALIYGQPGIGKTTLGLSAPQPLLLDFDGGVHRVSTLHQKDTVQISAWEDVMELLKEDLSAYQSLVIDTAGKMLDYMGAYLIKIEPKNGKSGGGLSLAGYGSRKAMFNDFLKTVAMMQKHLVFVAHDKEEKDGDQKTIRPEIGGSSGSDLIKELDLVGYVEAKGLKRTISFDPCEKFYGKNTCQLAPVILIPQLEGSTPNSFMISIFDTYKANLEARKATGQEYTDLIDLININVGDVANASEANDFIVWMNEVNHIWDSKLIASKLLRDRAKEIELIFDKDAKVYADPKPATTAKEEKPEKPKAEKSGIAIPPADLPTIDGAKSIEKTKTEAVEA